MPPGTQSSAKAADASRGAWRASVLITLATLAAYSNSFSGPFVLDDEASIVQNATIRRLWPLGGLLSPPLGTTVSGRPLLNISFALNYAISGGGVWSYHALNLLIHIAAGLTLFGIARRTLEGAGLPAGTRDRATPVALAAALLWSLHPLQTEAVTYVVQRAESLMGLFYLLALYGFIRGASADGRGAAGWRALSVASCWLGAATKEVIVTAPVLILLYDRAFIAGSLREAWRRRRGLHLALASSWILLAILVASTGGNRSGTSGFGVGVSFWAYWLTQFKAVASYLRLSLWPHPLVFEYGTFWMPGALAALPYAAVVLALAAAAAAALARHPRPGRAGAVPALGFCGAWFFAILSVTSVVPGIYQMIVEHRMYLPLAALAVPAALGIWRGLGRFAGPACLVLAMALGLATHARNEDYRSAVSLWQDTVDKRPDNETAQTSLAIALFDAGRAVEAVPHYEAALRVKPDATDTLNDLGCALLSLGRNEEGISRLRQVVKLEPGVPEYHFNLGMGLAAAGRVDEAIPQYRETIRLEPGHVQAHLRLGHALWLSGRREEALAERAEGLRLQQASGR